MSKLSMTTVAITMTTITLVFMTTGLAVVAAASGIGITFSRQTSQKLLPSVVADMLLANRIKKVRFLSINDGVLSAFPRTGIEIFVAIPNIELRQLGTAPKARIWLQRNVTRYIKEKEVNIRCISIGVEPFSLLETSRGDKRFLDFLTNYIENVQQAVKEDGISDKVKVTMTHATDVLEPVAKPSDGDFRSDIKEKMISIVKKLYDNGDPFTFNIYPLYQCINESYPFEFGLFDGNHNVKIQDGSLTYTNMFDLKYDTLVSALEKNGFHNMKIIVGATGWPTDGHVAATVENASRFYRGFMKKLANNDGTPLRPRTELDVFFYSLADENQRNTIRGPFERHYGIFRYDGVPKFNVDFTLQGRQDVDMVSAKGITYLPHRWCTLNQEAAQKQGNDAVKPHFEVACREGDCTPLEVGGSCGQLDWHDKVSYAFNSHFQMSNQDMSEITQACTYNGLGLVVDQEPQIRNCSFHLQILSTLFINGQSTGEMQATLGMESSCAQSRLQLDPPVFKFLLILFVFYLCIASR